MTEPRFVVLGVAHVRSAWFTEVARWSTSGSLPVEFVKCVSTTELLAHTDSGRQFSAALLDATLPAVDRDLVHHLARRHIPSFVVAGAVPSRDWAELGAAAVLPAALSPTHLLDALTAEAEPIQPTRAAAGDDVPRVLHEHTELRRRGPLVAVLGRSGAGASTIAIALAQDLADHADQLDLVALRADDPPRPVVLADLALRAHQALLHDAGDVQPGLPELVDAHRDGVPLASHVLGTTYQVPRRGYRLLLGLRRHAGWTGLPPRSLRAAVDGLRAAACVVVADVDADLEGEAETGSFDVEDRNRLARGTVQQADVVVAVCRPHATGVHGLVVLLRDLQAAGVDPARVLVVVNAAPRLPRRRAELARAIATLSHGPDTVDGERQRYRAMAFVPDRRSLDDLHLAVARLPHAITRPVGQAVLQLLEAGRHLDEPGHAAGSVEGEPVPVRAGELGHWGDGQIS